MKRSGIALVVMALVFSILSPAFSATPPKAGQKCTTLNNKQTYKNYQYTCVKKSGKLVWSKGVLVKKEIPSAAAPTSTPTAIPIPSAEPTPTSQPSANPSPSPTPSPLETKLIEKFDWSKTRSTDEGYINAYNGPCDMEQDISGKLAEIHINYYSHARCGGIYRVAKYELGIQRPKSALSSNTADLSPEQCKLAEPRNSTNTRGFFSLFDPDRLRYMNMSKVPGPKMSIQVVPIYAADTEKPINTPQEDYSVYLDFLTEWARYSSDGNSDISVKYPKEYLQFPNKVSSYGLYHENRHDHPDAIRFTKDLVAAVDSKIDFTGINMVIVVVPPGTPLNVFQQATIKNLQTNEGLIRVGTTEYPFTFSNMNSIKFSNFLVPFWWIHELYHSGIGLDDHYGDAKFDFTTEYGLGRWTLMTPWGGDLSAWEKWVMDFMTDDQIHCVNPQQSVTKWIAPSSVKTKEKKLIIVPISQHKGIAIESIRAAGLYYKIPKLSEGVLVYTIDLTILGHGMGLKLVPPTNRNPDIGPFFLSQVTLREGESVQSNGYKITIVESGTFGDVIKVERA